MVWIAIAYNLYYAVAYPIYNTANATMIPVSTRDSGQRSALASFTNVAGLADMGVGSMMFPMLVSFALKEDQHLWLVAMLTVAIFSVLTIYLQFAFTRERVTEEGMNTIEKGKSAGTVTISAQLHAVMSDRMWWIVMAFYLLFQWSGAMKNGSMTYFCKWVLDNSFYGTADAWGASQSLLSVLGAIPMAVAAVIVVPLANRYSKRLVCSSFMLLGAVGGVIAGLGGSQLVPVAVGVALKCLGSAPACYLILAMLADVIDHIEYRTGLRTDGLTMSIYSSLMVAGTPVCNAILSAMLAVSGYDQTANVALGTAAQSVAVQGTIRFSYIWMETICYVVGGILLFLFWTVERDLPKEQAAIARRKENCTQEHDQ